MSGTLTSLKDNLGSMIQQSIDKITIAAAKEKCEQLMAEAKAQVI